MHVTLEDAKAGVEAIIKAKGEDYVYIKDPKAIAAARANAEEQRAKAGNPTSDYWSKVTGVGTNAEGETIALNCTYRNLDGTPGCLVGHYMDAVLPGFVMEEEGWTRSLIAKTGVTMDEDASRFLEEVQGYQDMGYTWGSALNSALAVVEDND